MQPYIAGHKPSDVPLHSEEMIRAIGDAENGNTADLVRLLGSSDRTEQSKEA